jgi:hypothetical protein
MRIAAAAGTATYMLLLCCALWAAEVEPGADSAEGGEARPKVGVVGEVPPRPELAALSGVSAWIVNGREIPLGLVQERAAAWHGQYVLENLVADLLLQEEADRRGIVVTEEEVAQKVAALREELGVRSEAALESYLRAKLVTRDWLSAKAHTYVLMEKVLSEQIYVDDREIERAYRLNQDLYRRGDMVGFRAMRFLSEASATAALAEVRKGRSFQEVAKETAPTARERTFAGDIQYYERSQQSLPPEFEAALFAAPLNQVAGPVEIRGSYYLIRVEKKLDPRQFTLDDVRDVIRERLEKQKLEQIVWPNWIRDQLQRADIRVMMAEATPEAAPEVAPEEVPEVAPEVGPE